MVGMRFAQVRSRCDRNESHFPHVPLHGFAIDAELWAQRLGNLARTIERTGGVNLVNAMLDRHFVRRRGLALIIQTRAIQSQQFALRLERYFPRGAFDERPPLIPGETRCQIFF